MKHIKLGLAAVIASLVLAALLAVAGCDDDGHHHMRHDRDHSYHRD
ncbi:MAG: hypothetical protein WC869_13940 [Phycisphaerae bacterium]|jgi:hypothetical protein